MNGGITFRGAIEANKRYIISTLERNGEMFTNDIFNNYAGEKEKRAVRTALNELRKEGKVTTDDHVYMWQGKKWKLSLNAL